MLFASKYQRSQIILSFLVITLSFVIKNTAAGRDRGARCEKPDYISNGNYRMRRDRVLRITCNPGFQLQGPKTIDCVRGKWEGEKPVCAKKGCTKELEQPKNGRIQIENYVKAILFCSDNYNLAGNRHSYCNGTHWDRPIGNCREHKNVVQHECDFETDDICGWTYEPQEGLEWKRVMAANVFTTFKTGPRHDHTTLTANGGHYMLMESLTRQNDFITLTSPIYDRALSLKTACCFQFYYFMYGAGVGDLFVIVKPVSLSLDNVLKNHKDLIKFQKKGNQNNIWNEAHFNIEELEEDFQILFAAKSGHGQLSDIAVDDVRLLTGDDCSALDEKDDEDLSNEVYAASTYASIYETESCEGRCFSSSGSGLIRTFGHLKRLCNCDTDCEDNDTCCPDFRTVCLIELFAQSTVEYPTSIATTTTKINSTPITVKTTPTTVITTPTTIKTTPTTIKTTSTTIKTTSTTIKTTPETLKTTSTAGKTAPTIVTTVATTPTTTSTASKPIGIRTTKTTPKTVTTPKTTPTTTTRKTTPTKTTRKTTPTPTTRKTTPTTTTRKTTPATTTTTRKTTPATTTTRKTTPTTTTTRKTTQTITTNKTTTKTTTTTLKTTTITSTTPTPSTTYATSILTQAATSTKKPIPTSKSIEYIINDKSKTKATNIGSRLLLCTFLFIVIIILAGAVYGRFGDKAVAWYMIRFKHNNGGDEDTTSITTTFKQPHANSNNIERRPKINWPRLTKKSASTKNLINAVDEDDDDDIGANGNIALKNNIYTEL